MRRSLSVSWLPSPCQMATTGQYLPIRHAATPAEYRHAFHRKWPCNRILSWGLAMPKNDPIPSGVIRLTTRPGRRPFEAQLSTVLALNTRNRRRLPLSHRRDKQHTREGRPSCSSGLRSSSLMNRILVGLERSTADGASVAAITVYPFIRKCKFKLVPSSPPV